MLHLVDPVDGHEIPIGRQWLFHLSPHTTNFSSSAMTRRLFFCVGIAAVTLIALAVRGDGCIPPKLIGARNRPSDCRCVQRGSRGRRCRGTWSGDTAARPYWLRVPLQHAAHELEQARTHGSHGKLSGGRRGRAAGAFLSVAFLPEPAAEKDARKGGCAASAMHLPPLSRRAIALYWPAYPTFLSGSEKPA